MRSATGWPRANPRAQPLPDVPELTEMLRDADWDFSWQEERRIFAHQPGRLVLLLVTVGPPSPTVTRSSTYCPE